MIFTSTTLIGTSTLKILNYNCHKYWMPDLEKNRNINIATKILLRKIYFLRQFS